MRQLRLTKAPFALAFLCCSLCSAAEPFLDPVLKYSADDSLCQEANRVVNLKSIEIFKDIRDWAPLFGESPLEEVPNTYAAQGPAPMLLQQAALDIDSDGEIDQIFVSQSFFRSVSIYHLHFTTPANYADALRENRLAKSVLTWPSTNPFNTIEFINGQSGVPTELALWTPHDTTLLVFKEERFGQPGYSYATSLFVARVPQSASVVRQSPSKQAQVTLELLCKFTSSKWPTKSFEGHGWMK